MRRVDRDQRGVTSVMVAVLVSAVLVVSAAFAVDLGQQRVVRRDMQAIADVVALDLARHLTGGFASTYDKSALDAAKNQSVARNGDALGGEVPAADVLWEFVMRNATDDGWTTIDKTSTTEKPTAIRVTTKSDIGFAFGGVTGVKSGSATRNAVAESAGGACFTIGSYAARLNTAESPLLGPLLGALGSNVTLSAVDYNGLANTNIGLLNLLGASVGAGTLDSLLKTDPALISLGDFYLAAADVLGPGHAAQVTLLQAMAVGVEDIQLDVGDILGVGTTGTSGLDASLNLFDLVTAAASAASKQHAIDIPQVGVNLSPLANVNASLSVIEPPQMGCGRKNTEEAKAHSSQVDLDLSTSLANVTVPGLLETKVALSGAVSVASADGRLTDVRCAPTGITVSVSDGLITVDLRLEITVSLNVLGIKIPVAGGPIKITGSKSLIESPADKIIINDPDYDTPATVGYSRAGLPVLSTDVSGFKLIGLPLGVTLAPILNSLTSGLINPLITSLDSVVGRLLHVLGADLSGADVYARRTPQCDAPKLVG